MRHSLKTGMGFGLTSGVITTLGLIVGLHSGTGSRFVVLGGIITIAIADAFSDALGIHISEESENQHTHREIWESTIFTFVAKFLAAMMFIVPVLLLPLNLAIIISIIWGFLLLGFFSFYIAKLQNKKPPLIIGEHLLIASLVIIITHFLGEWINFVFN